MVRLQRVRLRVKEVAQAKGFTVARLERTAAIDIKTLRNAWHYPDHPISLPTLEKLAVALGVPVLLLLEDVPFEQEEGKYAKEG